MYGTIHWQLCKDHVQVGLRRMLSLSLQVACILPFMRLGEFVLQAPKLDAAPTAIKDVLFSDPGAALKGIGHALLGWVLAAPVLVVLFAKLLRPVFAWAAQRRVSYMSMKTTLIMATKRPWFAWALGIPQILIH